MKDKTYNLVKKISEKVLGVGEHFLKAWLNTTVGQGFLKRFIDFAVEKMFDEIVEPFMKIALVKIGYSLDVKEGKRLVIKLEEAKENNDENGYNSTVDDILS